jgi:uncharacterized protein YeaO (DUF488 family)
MIEMIRTKSFMIPKEENDGSNLITRYWPRGIKKIF